MLIVRLFTLNGNLYSTSFCISAILEWEFRRDSISRCFCCWRLVRPPGDPAAEEEALLVRGKSQLILPGSPGPRPSSLRPASAGGSVRRRFSDGGAGRTDGRTDARGPSASSRRARRGVPASSGACYACGSWAEGARVPGSAPLPPRLRRRTSPAASPRSLHCPQLPPCVPRPLRAASSAGAAARTYATRRDATRRRSSGRRSSGSLPPAPGERRLWGIRRRRRARRRRRVQPLWRGGGGEARAQRHKYTNKG